MLFCRFDRPVGSVVTSELSGPRVVLSWSRIQLERLLQLMQGLLVVLDVDVKDLLVTP